MAQTELPLTAAQEAVTFTASADCFGYWHLRVSTRRSGSREWQYDTYDALTSDELSDVLEAVAGQLR